MLYNLRHTHMLRHVTGLGGWGEVVAFMIPCVTCTLYVTSLGWGVLTFMLTCVACTCYVTSLGWEVLQVTFMITCVTCTCYVTSLDWLAP